MPISLHTDHRIRITLETDKDVTPSPCFVFRAPTMMQELKLGQIVESQTTEQLFNRICDQLGMLLVDWEHMEREFDPTTLPTLINFREGLELVRELLASGRQTLEEKKS